MSIETFASFERAIGTYGARRRWPGDLPRPGRH
jgi:hypothetical protein